MKPGDHPDFFRLPPPPGTSRESSLRLDREGQFWFEGERIEHPRLFNALNAWITRHPDDGRYILTNGYDWTYFHVDDVPFFVRSVHEAGSGLELSLSDGSSLPFSGEGLAVGDDEALYVPVSIKGSEFEAKFTRYAQAQLEPWLAEGPDGRVGVRFGDRVVVPTPRVARGQALPGRIRALDPAFSAGSTTSPSPWGRGAGGARSPWSSRCARRRWPSSARSPGPWGP